MSYSKYIVLHQFKMLITHMLYRYFVEFSKPTKEKPIPEGIVNVYFDIIQGDGDDYEIEFSFESESLKHKLGKQQLTLRDK